MLRVGLTGGLASGKSFVGRELAALGCHVLSADAIGHEVLLPGGAAYDAVVREFGHTILSSDGEIDRRVLGKLVFEHPERLQALNQIVHPAVYQREDELMAEFARQDPHGISVLEAAILIETGSYKRFQALILTVCPPEVQLARAVERGLTREEAEARLLRQMPLAEKIPYADYLIDTSGTKDNTIEQTHAVWQALRSKVS